MGRLLRLADVEAAVKGGSIFAAGGGGWAEHGRMLGAAAIEAGSPELVSMDEVPDEAWIATAAAIGAPGESTDWEMQSIDYVNAVRLLQDELGEPLYGLIIGQNGMSSTLNAWLPGSILGTKVIDAVGDIRAHPTGDMGSLGMANSPEPTIQTAAGGNRAQNRYIELVVRGATAKVSPILRTAADMAGGFVASCRNPLRASYVRKHAALGGISRALALGEAIIGAEPRGGKAVIDAVCRAAPGAILFAGTVEAKNVIYTKDAFDIGTITLRQGANVCILHVMNEYMAADDGNGGRLATYPDVLTTLDPEGRPVPAGRLRVGQAVLLLHIAKADIPLSSSISDPSVYAIVENALGIRLAEYALRDAT